MISKLDLLRYEIGHVKKDQFKFWFAWRLPHWVVYMCGIRLWANATCGRFGDEIATDTMMEDVMKRWDERQGGDPSFHDKK